MRHFIAKVSGNTVMIVDMRRQKCYYVDLKFTGTLLRCFGGVRTFLSYKDEVFSGSWTSVYTLLSLCATSMCVWPLPCIKHRAWCGKRSEMNLNMHQAVMSKIFSKKDNNRQITVIEGNEHLCLMRENNPVLFDSWEARRNFSQVEA